MRIRYSGSKGWLIFWVLIFWPVALVMFLLKMETYK